MQSQTILQIADELVASSRQSDYGPPSESMACIGRIWGAILGTEAVPPHKVALMMAGLKIARESMNHKRDNLIDGVGYLHIADLIAEERK